MPCSMLARSRVSYQWASRLQSGTVGSVYLVQSVTASRFPAVCLQSKVVCLQSSPGAAKRESPRNAYAVTRGTLVMVAPEGGGDKERERQTRPDLGRTHFRVARPLPP